MAKELMVRIVGDSASLERSLKQASTAAGGFGSTLGKVGKVAGTTIGATALAGITATLKVGYGEWQDSTKIAAQTAAGLKSTGNAAHVTAKHISDLAGAVLSKSGIDDEAVQSGENMLLTFTNLRNEAGKGNDVFDKTTRVMADMATKMNNGAAPSAEQMKTQAILLGKALNDPVKGLTALTRVGVSFDESTKKQITSLVKSGKTMDAQKVILKELNKEFGGSAEAMGSTLPGKISILKEQFNNLAGEIVGGLMPTLMKVVTWVTANWPQISAVMKTVFSTLGTIVKTVVVVLGTLVSTMVDVGRALVSAGKFVADHKALLVGLAAAVGAVLVPALGGLAIALGSSVIAFGAEAIAAAAAWVATMGPITLVVAAVGLVAAAVYEVITHWQQITAFFTGLWNTVTGSVSTAVDTIVGFFTALPGRIAGVVSGAVSTLERIGTSIVSGVLDGLKSVGGFAADAGRWLKNRIVEGVKAYLGEILALGTWYVTHIWEGVKAVADFASNVGGWIKNRVVEGVTAGIDAIKTLGGQVTGWVVSGITGVAGLAGDVGGWLLGKIQAAGRAIAKDVEAVGATIGHGIASGIRGALNIGSDVLNAIISAVNSAIGWINDHRPSILGHHLFPELPTIPRLALGGFGSGLTLVGERGPELVSLPAGSYVHTAGVTARTFSGAGGIVFAQGSIVVQAGMVGDADRVADQLVDAINRKIARQGVVFRGGALAAS